MTRICLRCEEGRHDKCFDMRVDIPHDRIDYERCPCTDVPCLQNRIRWLLQRRAEALKQLNELEANIKALLGARSDSPTEADKIPTKKSEFPPATAALYLVRKYEQEEPKRYQL